MTLSSDDGSAMVKTRLQLLTSSSKTLVYQSLLFAVSLLPTRLAFRIARSVGGYAYRRRRVSAQQRQVAIQRTLDVRPVEAARLVRRSFELGVCDDLDYWFYRSASKRKVDHLIDIQGLEHLDSVLSKGRGAILCSGHLNGLFLFLVALSGRGYKVNVVRRQPSKVSLSVDRWFNERRTLIRGRTACNFLWMHPTNFGVAVQASNALRRNEIVVMLLDPRVPTNRVVVNFFNHPTSFPSAHVLIAQTSGAPLLDFFIHRSRDLRRLHAEICRPLHVSDDTNDTLSAVTHFISRLEHHIRRDPGSWIRWSRPEYFSTNLKPTRQLQEPPRVLHTGE